MQLTGLVWLGGLLSLAYGEPQRYGYGYGYFTGTGTSPPYTASAPYGNTSTSYYVPTGTAPYSTGIPSTSADPSGAPYKTYNASGSGYYPTYHPTHGPYPFPTGKAVYMKRSSNTTGDPSGKVTWASGTAASTGFASTGFASAPSSFGTSGAYTYTAPTGIPSEYFYHHRKPKRNARNAGGYGYWA